jgi:hypothetical protein
MRRPPPISTQPNAERTRFRGRHVARLVRVVLERELALRALNRLLVRVLRDAEDARGGFRRQTRHRVPQSSKVRSELKERRAFCGAERLREDGVTGVMRRVENRRAAGSTMVLLRHAKVARQSELMIA